MVSVRRVIRQGNLMYVQMDDGSKVACYPTPNGFWMARANSYGGTPDPGDGGGGTPGAPLYNPWADWYHGGTWADHGSYSAGGQDYGGSAWYDREILAPTSGTLYNSGNHGPGGEYTAGYIGSAGQRSILILDSQYPRKVAGESYPQEGGDTLAAIVVQHLNRTADEGHKDQNAVIGYVGNSGTDVIHLHVHGLDPEGRRVDFLKFI